MNSFLKFKEFIIKEIEDAGVSAPVTEFTLTSDINLDSLDWINILMNIELNYGIAIPDDIAEDILAKSSRILDGMYLLGQKFPNEIPTIAMERKEKLKKIQKK